MEVQTKAGNGGSDEGNGGFMATCRLRLRSSVDKLRRHSVVGFAGKLAKVARDDPRRLVHSLKVGLALTLVSVVYYVTPLFHGHTNNTIWAVITVVVVMEFTVGGTLSKGLNRAFATLLAGLLAVGAHLVADLCGEKGEPILLGVFVFFVASTATFTRFIPVIKARHDYGVTIFILTFSLVAVSSYRVDKLVELAHQRLTTILVGVATCLVTTFIFPVWAGEDLSELTASNLDKLAKFLEGIESECFQESTTSENLEGKSFLHAYQSVLNSNTRYDSLCYFARWEPGHGKFSFRHPWSQYQEIGVLCRQCASSMEALASYLVPIMRSMYPEANSELCLKVVRRTCGEMNLQSAKALRELSSAIRNMTIPAVSNNDMSKAMEAANRLISELVSEDTILLQVMHIAVISSRISDVVSHIKKITEAVDNLARLAHFKKPRGRQVGVVIDIVS